MVKKYLDNRLYTKKEFEECLRQVYAEKNVSIRYVVTDSLGNQFEYGQKSEQKVRQTQTLPLKNQYEVNMELRGHDANIDIIACEEIFRSYWNDEYSDKTTGFPTTEQPLVLEKCENTLKYYYENNQKLALIMVDLDHFKEVNECNNHDVGSRVLGEFAQLLFSVFYKYGIMIHQTGDEFNILFPYNNIVEVVHIVQQAREKIKIYHFDKIHEINLTMAVGVKCIEKELIDYITARNMAEKIYNNNSKRNSSKQRDSIRIDGIYSSLNGPMNLKFAWARIVCNLDCAISGNVFLEFIKEYAEKFSEIERFKERIDDIIDWINPEWQNSLRYTLKNTLIDTTEKFSELELCLAIMQGLLKNSNYLEKKFVFKTESNNLRVYMDNKVIYECVNSFHNEDFEGNCIEYYRRNSNRKCKRVILIQAGYAECPIPEDVFCKVIQVDTRPTTGGGLPDFWAAALCGLITIMKNNPIVSDILIYGKIQDTRNIIELLDSIDEWESHPKYNFKYISQKTFKSIEDIREFKNKFRNRIFKCNDLEELYSKVCQVYNSDVEEEVEFVATKNTDKRRILERNLSYEKIMLNICDGCRVKTIADAYPTVLEILRYQKKQVQNKIKDQAGRELLELLDFKIVLSAPHSSDLPDYYTYDKQLLEEYYNRTFGKEDSLFRKKLIEDKQIEVLIKHILQVLKGKNNYATRRAVLVVPNVVEDEDNYSPLGLISVWLAPRFVDNRVVIDYSYNWRTVEAVVGLPLSIYASVKFAEDITNLIREQAVSCEQSISIGAVSYIAHSLHMFMEVESMDIVRGIINDASI